MINNSGSWGAVLSGTRTLLDGIKLKWEAAGARIRYKNGLCGDPWTMLGYSRMVEWSTIRYKWRTILRIVATEGDKMSIRSPSVEYVNEKYIYKLRDVLKCHITWRVSK